MFRTASVGDVFTDDLFLDGHPPFWRFQLPGVAAFASWLAGYCEHGIDTTVVRSGDWDAALRRRHAAETTILRP